MKTVARRFWAELGRRRVIRTAIAYVVGAWVIVEVSATVLPALNVPDFAVTLIIVVAMLAFPIVLALAWTFDIERAPATAAVLETTVRAHPLPPELSGTDTSVAVLPFDSLSDDPDHRFLARSIATELHGTLSRVHRLRVIARLSSFAYGGQQADVRDVGRSLGARFVIAGSVLCVDDRMRVTVEVDDAADGTQMWSRSYERSPGDLLRVMTEIAEDVAVAFGGVQLENEIRSAVSASTDNASAWTRVQRARNYLLNFTPRALDEALALLEEAVAMDADYPVAQATLAAVLGERVVNGFSADIAGDGRRALATAGKACEAAANDPFVLKLTGVVAAWFGETGAAFKRLRRSVELAPYDFGAWGYLGWPLAATGDEADLDELQSIMTRMLDATPSHPGAPFWLYHRSVALTCRGEHTGAVESAAASVERNPRFPLAWLQYANALGATGRCAEARVAAERAATLGPHLTIAHYEAVIRQMCRRESVVLARTAGVRAALADTAEEPANEA